MLVKGILSGRLRNIWQQTSRNMSENKLSQTVSEKVAAMSPTDLVKNMVRVSDWNKKLLVYAKKYKTTAEIPDVLPYETVDRARNKVRIKVANIMMAMTLVGTVVMITTGKQRAERGETVSKMNLDWHKEYNEKARQEAEQAAAKKG